MKKYLVLENGQIFVGEGFGASQDVVGEIVFNTGMSGYQETITDQSYNGQIITFTYPLIGNAGINRDDYESIKPTTKAIVVKNLARATGNWRAKMTLAEFLEKKGIPGISGIDTRQLTKIIREAGAMKAAIVTEVTPQTVAELQQVELPTDNVAQVATKNAYPAPGTGLKVVVVDFGLKHSILRELAKRSCNIVVVPPTTTAAEIIEQAPDGVMLTNGPGDPKSLPEVLPMIREIQAQIPLFGICLGHQLFALANGADTFKMKYGHRGFNHPVREIATGRIDFTSQNHGYAVAKESLGATDLLMTHEEINDETVEGIRHRHFPAFSVQYHPDAAPGPHDAVHLFDEFVEMMQATNQNAEKE